MTGHLNTSRLASSPIPGDVGRQKGTTTAIVRATTSTRAVRRTRSETVESHANVPLRRRRRSAILLPRVYHVVHPRRRGVERGRRKRVVHGRRLLGITRNDVVHRCGGVPVLLRRNTYQRRPCIRRSSRRAVATVPNGGTTARPAATRGRTASDTSRAAARECSGAAARRDPRARPASRRDRSSAAVGRPLLRPTLRRESRGQAEWSSQGRQGRAL